MPQFRSSQWNDNTACVHVFIFIKNVLVSTKLPNSLYFAVFPLITACIRFMLSEYSNVKHVPSSKRIPMAFDDFIYLSGNMWLQ